MSILLFLFTCLRVISHLRTNFIHYVLRLRLVSQVLSLEANEIDDGCVTVEIAHEAENDIVAVVELVQWQGVVELAKQVLSK